MDQKHNLKGYFALISLLLFTFLGAGIQTALTVEEFKYIDAISENHGLTTGTLTQIICNYVSEDTTITYEITYKVDDEFYSKSTRLYWFPEEHETGEQFEMIYNIYRPGMARVHVFSEYYLPMILQLAGVLFLAGVFLLILKKRHWILSLKFSDDWI